MRHLGSIVLSMLLVPIVYVLTGIGLVDWSVAESGSSLDYPRLAVALVTLLGAGLAYAVLVLARLSPLGLILAGLARARVRDSDLAGRTRGTAPDRGRPDVGDAEQRPTRGAGPGAGPAVPAASAVPAGLAGPGAERSRGDAQTLKLYG